MRYSTKVKDQEGFPSFCLINKATGEAVKHSIGATHPVRLVPYNPDYLDESVLWSESASLPFFSRSAFFSINFLLLFFFFINSFFVILKIECSDFRGIFVSRNRSEEMPYCDCENGVRIFYKRFGNGSTKALLIIGLAGTHDSWEPQIRGLTGAAEANDDLPAVPSDDRGLEPADEEEVQDGIELCCFDNRGMGRSSVPSHKSEYTTTIMARDALALLDHLGWKRAHVFGHSMGGMIACKLAALVPGRISSLALLNVTGGGFECFPKIDRQMISLAFRFLSARTPEQRAIVDLETHYTTEYLDEHVGSCRRRDILYKEYVKNISSSGMQSNHGFEGQVNACWNHKMTPKELERIRSTGFLISIIHGRHDIIAQVNHAKNLAEKLQPVTRMVELHGAHLVSHERPDEVNQALRELIIASKGKLNPQEWSWLPERQTLGARWSILGTKSCTRNNGNSSASNLLTVYNFLGKIQLSFLYFLGFFLIAYEHMRSILRTMKPARVAASNP